MKKRGINTLFNGRWAQIHVQTANSWKIECGDDLYDGRLLTTPQTHEHPTPIKTMKRTQNANINWQQYLIFVVVDNVGKGVEEACIVDKHVVQTSNSFLFFLIGRRPIHTLTGVWLHPPTSKIPLVGSWLLLTLLAVLQDLHSVLGDYTSDEVGGANNDALLDLVDALLEEVDSLLGVHVGAVVAV